MTSAIETLCGTTSMRAAPIHDEPSATIRDEFLSAKPCNTIVNTTTAVTLRSATGVPFRASNTVLDFTNDSVATGVVGMSITVPRNVAVSRVALSCTGQQIFEVGKLGLAVHAREGKEDEGEELQTIDVFLGQCDVHNVFLVGCRSNLVLHVDYTCDKEAVLVTRTSTIRIPNVSAYPPRFMASFTEREHVLTQSGKVDVRTTNPLRGVLVAASRPLASLSLPNADDTRQLHLYEQAACELTGSTTVEIDGVEWRLYLVPFSTDVGTKITSDNSHTLIFPGRPFELDVELHDTDTTVKVRTLGVDETGIWKSTSEYSMWKFAPSHLQ